VVSFRYHLVTIVAVFLALGLGVLAGTTVLDQSLVNSLENRQELLTADLNELRGEVAELQSTAAAYEQVVEELAPTVSEGLLFGGDIVVVTHEGVDGAALAQALDSLEVSGANIRAVLTVRDQMAAEDPKTREELATILDLSASTEGSKLTTAAADALARRLDGGGGEREDVLSLLLSAGFLTGEGSGLSDGAIGQLGVDDAVVVVSGGRREPTLEPGEFLVPMVDELVHLGSPVAASESVDTVYPFVATIREDGVGDGEPIVTVDDVDLSIGGLALTLGLQRLLNLDEGGDYGVKAGASEPIPPLAGA